MKRKTTTPAAIRAALAAQSLRTSATWHPLLTAYVFAHFVPHIVEHLENEQ